MKKLKCVIVGLGRIGSTLEKDKLREKPCTHAGAVIHNSHCILSGGCDIKPDKCLLFIKTWQCGMADTNLEKVLLKTNPDILHIATPPETHFEIIKSVLDYNSSIKLIICEKPVALKKDSGLKILNLVKPGGTKILVNHERRYSLDYLKVKKHIKRHTCSKC